MRCPSARAPGKLARGFSDFDVAIKSGDQKRTTSAMAAFDLVPAQRFNAVHGASRLLFERSDGLHADVFVGRFELCHTLPLSQRLSLDDTTLPLADLLLTKLQVARLTRKDVSDAAALLLDHELTDDDRGVNVRYIADLLAADWGWWRTVTENLGRVQTSLDDLPLNGADRQVIEGRLAEIQSRVDAAPKGARWRVRARVGDRRPWRQEPEERA